MPQRLDPAYFQRPPFAGALPGECFGSYLCTVCGNRSKTWASFRAHRAGPECFPAVAAGHAESHGPAWQKGLLTDADRDALASLIEQLPDPEPIDTAQWLEETVS